MATNRSNITKQLVPGIRTIVGLNYGAVAEEHKPLFDLETSVRAFEEDVMQSGLGNAVGKTEGQAVTYDDMQELWTARYNMETVALGFAITEEAMEDNLYDTFSKARAQQLGRSMASTKQIRAANVYNLAFSASQLGGDGVALCSASHPVITGSTQSNTASADISETALESAIIEISLFRDDRGIIINATPKSLILPPHLQFAAHRILKSTLSTTIPASNTNVNDTNALKDMGFFPGGIHVNRRLTDTDAWFIRTDVPNGMKMFQRVKLQTKDEGDFDTGNFKFKARERYTFGWTDWRGVYGSQGA